MNNLPRELWALVFEHLAIGAALLKTSKTGRGDLAAARMVCRQWRSLIGFMGQIDNKSAVRLPPHPANMPWEASRTELRGNHLYV